MWESLSGPPFLMVIETDDGVATVQFVQPGKSLVSKSLRIDLDRPLEGRHVVALNSPTVTIPGGQIEFADTSLMPGRFKIRLGRTLFDVMPAGIHVDGQHFEWVHGDPIR
jgi:hypothetical protein